MVYEILSGWDTDLLAEMKRITVGLPGGGAALVKRVVDNLHARYISLVTAGAALPRYDSPAGDVAATALMRRLVADVGISAALARAFLVSLYLLQKSGAIPASKYDPVGERDRREARTKVDPSALDKIASGAKAVGGVYAKLGIGLAIVGVLGALVYFRVGRK